ncbi:TPA: glycosyltransferase family 2 protein [Candidatus Berkelbacteria bacterium]|uniref:dolichyl-phosphate beta-glucosyltransferase n=1 Tax=Berkelbacteria bacterium GW2011_GWE1_39_12 TaxID=1618337 RepID=A0A0G4B410_9BACT|nr:MAG: glycosyl transferase family protein [Berkelbacteria bacterium GW2011_GWE1_39_12]HBO60746.1 glycosyltransferase family 2 protein [Candidatus Berkelbacteria bacterium]
MDKPYLSIILPAFNEEKRLLDTLIILKAFLEKQKYDGEVIIVNDGSTDNTRKKVNELIKTWPNFKIVSYKNNRGKGYAVKTGMLAAKGQWRLMMDSDNSTDISEIKKLQKYIKQSEIIVGSRYLRKDSIKTAQPLFRRFISRGGNLLIRLFLGIKSKDTQCGFKLFSEKAVLDIFPKQTIDRWGFDMELLVIARKNGYKVKEVAVDWYNVENSRVTNFMTFATLNDLWIIKKNTWAKKY